MLYVKINDSYYAARINFVYKDRNWEGRKSAQIFLELPATTVSEFFIDDASWSVTEDPLGGELTDYSDYCVAGEIIDYRNGTVSVKMGKLLDEEIINILTGGK